MNILFQMNLTEPPAPKAPPPSPSRRMTGQGAIDPGEPFDPVKGEKAMWRAVIVQALMDAASLSHKKENRQHREEALIWLRGNSPDFSTVCYHAGFEPDYVRSMVRLSLERECRWRAEPGKGPEKKRPGREKSLRQPHQRR